MKLLLSFLFLTSIHFSFSQDSTYKFLQKYKYRTNGYSAVAINGNANENFVTQFTNGNSSTISLNPNFTGFTTKSTDKYLSTSNINISLGFNSNKNNPSGSTSKSTNFNYEIVDNRDTKKYHNNNFLELGFSARIYQTFIKQIFPLSYTTLQNNGTASAAIILGIGRGRLENVTDAQIAYNILNDLSKNNLLNKTFTQDEILSLSKTITNVNNRRIFDFRNKHKFELQQIDSCLQKLRLIKEQDINYFTTITDNWFYNFNPVRNVGRIKYIQLQPTAWSNQNIFKYKMQPTDSVDKNVLSSIGTSLVIGIESDIARNMKWQFNKGIQLSTNIMGYKQNSNSSIKNYSELSTYLLGFLQWGYYPNTRTNVSATIQNVASYGLSLNSIKNFLNNTVLNFTGNYFINNNTRITLTTGINFQAIAFSSSNAFYSLQQYFSFGVQHYFK